MCGSGWNFPDPHPCRAVATIPSSLSRRRRAPSPPSDVCCLRNPFRSHTLTNSDFQSAQDFFRRRSARTRPHFHPAAPTKIIRSQTSPSTSRRPGTRRPTSCQRTQFARFPKHTKVRDKFSPITKFDQVLAITGRRGYLACGNDISYSILFYITYLHLFPPVPIRVSRLPGWLLTLDVQLRFLTLLLWSNIMQLTSNAKRTSSRQSSL